MEASKMTLQEIGDKLSKSIYQEEACGKFGETGIEKERFENEILFETYFEHAHIIRAEEYGVTAGTDVNMREPLEKLLQMAKDMGNITKKILLPKGDICIYDKCENNKYALDLQGMQNLVIEGDETVFLMDMTSRGIRVENCENIVLRNMSFDRIELPYFTGTVEKMDAKEQYAILKINEGYHPENPYPVREYLEYNVADKTPRYHGNFLYNNMEVDTMVESIQSVTMLEGNRAKITFSWDLTEAPEGCGYVITKTMYGIDTIAIIHSKEVRCENVNIYCTPGMGIRGYSSENIYMNKTNVMLRPGTDRYMSVTADAMHFMDCKGDLQLTNCLMENSHDDSINIHGMYQMIVEADEENNRYRMVCGRVAKFNEPELNEELTIPFEVGDEIEVSEDDTLRLLSTVHVETVESDQEGGFWVTFREKERLAVGVLMANVTRSPKVLVENCIFRNKRNRGILLQSRNSVIRNCAFYNVLMPAICIVADCQNWHESISAKGIRIERNRFINTNLIKNNFGNLGKGDIDIAVYSKNGAIEDGLIEELRICDNVFIASGGNCISAKSMKNSEISGNLFYKYGSELPEGSRKAIIAETPEAVRIENNTAILG